MPFGIISTFGITVAPVVVSPDTASKNASVKEGNAPDIVKGNAPNIEMINHPNVTIVTASFAFKYLFLTFNFDMKRPKTTMIKMVVINARASPLL